MPSLNPQTRGRRMELVQLLVQSGSQDTLGQPLLSFSLLATMWAWVYALTGREAFAQQQFQPEVSYRVTVRYQDVAAPLATGALVKMWLLYNDGIGDHYLDIQATVAVDQRQQWVDLLCLDRVGLSLASPVVWGRRAVSGSMDGVNRLFTLDAAIDPASALVINNGLKRLANSYAIVGLTLNLGWAPDAAAGDTLEVYGATVPGPIAAGNWGKRTLSGAMDGVNQAFTLDAAIDPASALVIGNGLKRLASSYTIVGLTLVLSWAPAAAAGDTLELYGASTAGNWGKRTLSGAMDGVNQAFTLDAAIDPASALVIGNGLKRLASSYTIVGLTLNLSWAPAAAAGDTLEVYG